LDALVLHLLHHRKEGTRVEVQIPPIAANDGSCVTIRKFNEIK
jgi:Flp pilus assembly CpaF family ATPase